MEKKTVLYERHLAGGGKMVPFAGYLMPVQYQSGVMAEHRAVRAAAGLFDVCHMGEVLVEGPGAFGFLQRLLTNDMRGLAAGGCRYSPMCNEAGGVVDDLLVYRLSEERFMLVVNASNREKDVQWMRRWLPQDAAMADASDETAELALQGPGAQAILARLAGGAAHLPARYYSFAPKLTVAGVPCLVSRTGYTAEDGFELYCGASEAPGLWDALLQAGEGDGLVPCGLGARDTLRLEGCMPLYGHEMDEETTPLQAGLGFFVKMDKAEDFLGKKALAEKNPPSRRRTGLRVTGKGIARQGCAVYRGGAQVGVVTSGTLLPTLGWAGAMALVDVDAREEGTALQVDVRGRHVEAEVVKMPFYRREK